MNIPHMLNTCCFGTNAESQICPKKIIHDKYVTCTWKSNHSLSWIGKLNVSSYSHNTRCPVYSFRTFLNCELCPTHQW